ncbi:MAG: hypothetical protein MUF58_14340 [Arcicella sp.]|jgi:hypothetical protein|nr:hypothetical protein [Arcicella sp.]
MENFNVNNYSNKTDNQIFKVKLYNEVESFFASKIHKSVTQAYQLKFTPITKVSIEKILDIKDYLENKSFYFSGEIIYKEPEEIEKIEILELDKIID